jgi:IMP dehydrogenase
MIYGTNSYDDYIGKAFSFKDVDLVPSFSDINSRKDVDVSVLIDFPDESKNRLELYFPFIPSNMDSIATPELGEAIINKGGLFILHRFMSDIEMINIIHRLQSTFSSLKTEYLMGVSLGVGEMDYDRASRAYDKGIRIFCVDVAHGHHSLVMNALSKLKNLKGAILIAGNVVTPAGFNFLTDSGADIVKVGIANGHVCRTKNVTGFSYPQLSAIWECAEQCKVPIISDGGIKEPGDAVKTLAFGASMVMMGSAFSATVEASRGQETHFYRGMASKEAQEDYFGHMPDWKTSEGASIMVNTTTTVDAVLNRYIGGLRSGLSYAGARNIIELQQKTKFVFVK